MPSLGFLKCFLSWSWNIRKFAPNFFIDKYLIKVKLVKKQCTACSLGLGCSAMFINFSQKPRKCSYIMKLSEYKKMQYKLFFKVKITLQINLGGNTVLINNLKVLIITEACFPFWISIKFFSQTLFSLLITG